MSPIVSSFTSCSRNFRNIVKLNNIIISYAHSVVLHVDPQCDGKVMRGPGKLGRWILFQVTTKNGSPKFY